MKRFSTLLQKLIQALSSCEEVLAIGQTGQADKILLPGDDIDWFVLCRRVLPYEDRLALYQSLGFTNIQMQVASGGLWGYGDILSLGDDITLMPMYFTKEEMQDYTEQVLKGQHLNKAGGFYPVGRLSSIENIQICWEREEAWSALVARVREKPPAFFKAWFMAQSREILSLEDLDRLHKHREVFFAHQVMEDALDHLLQALFALNFTYFPSRKRTEKFLSSFSVLPNDCLARLKRMMQAATFEETVPEAAEILRALASETVDLGQQVFKSRKEN